MRKIAIHQPNFMPWVGWWNKVAMSDVMVLLDNAQFSKGDYHNRMQLMGGWATVPVKHHPIGTLISEVEISSHVPLRKLAKTIRYNFKSPHFDRIQDILDLLEGYSDPSLLTLNHKLIACLKHALGLGDKRIVSHSGLSSGSPTLDIAEIVHKHMGDTYLAGWGAQSYSARHDYPIPRVRLQSVRGLYTDVISLLTTCEDPKAYIMTCGQWTDWVEQKEHA